jgi:hypothetical protein
MSSSIYGRSENIFVKTMGRFIAPSPERPLRQPQGSRAYVIHA